MKIKKRDGREVEFDKLKIVTAILKSFKDVDGEVSEYAISKAENIANYIEKEAQVKQLDVEAIQDMVENGLMSTKRKDVARAYISYRNDRTFARGNAIDKVLEEMLGGTSDYWNTENSNKNAKAATTQRDYMAGIVSTDMARRRLVPREVVEAHDAGIIHFHDMDYFAQQIANCDLINLNDMLQNGTSINGMMIEKPHRLITASTIATQIILGVSSSQYGGCTVTLTHLAPFVRASREFHKKFFQDAGVEGAELERLVDKALKKEIQDAVQTFNYQLNSMTNTNGQAPFLSVCMYLNETQEYKEELAMLIEEFLKQRITGFKNDKGVYITPAFPGK